MAVGSWRLAVGSWRWAVGRKKVLSAECWVLSEERKWAVGSWQGGGEVLSAECWVLSEERKWAVGSGRLAVGSWRWAVLSAGVDNQFS